MQPAPAPLDADAGRRVQDIEAAGIPFDRIKLIGRTRTNRCCAAPPVSAVVIGQTLCALPGWTGAHPGSRAGAEKPARAHTFSGR